MATGSAVHDSGEEDLAPHFVAIDGDRVHRLNHITIGQAVGQHMLAVDDDVGIGNGQRHHLFGDLAQI